MKSDVFALECINLTKIFGGLVAVNGVNLKVKPGERRAILGPNGAGKTTLFSLISGLHTITSGFVKMNGQDISSMPAHGRAHLGLGRTFQITNLFPSLSVMENLIIASIGLKNLKFSMIRPLYTYKDLYIQAEKVLDSMGMVDKRNVVVKNLSYGEQRQIELSAALICNPKVLLLDEPTAGLSPADSATMAEIIKNLNSKITILIIEHNMDVALQVASYITVLNQGSNFAEGSPSEIQNNDQVQEIYFGRDD
jgi:branched-chain amino acid transport system ATP-binding protein